RFADRRHQRRRREQKHLAQQRGFHSSMSRWCRWGGHHARRRVKYLRRTVRLDGERRGGRMRRLLWRNLDLELAAGCVASDFGRKLSTGRADFELLDRKIFARFHDDCLWL